MRWRCSFDDMVGIRQQYPVSAKKSMMEGRRKSIRRQLRALLEEPRNLLETSLVYLVLLVHTGSLPGRLVQQKRSLLSVWWCGLWSSS